MIDAVFKGLPWNDFQTDVHKEALKGDINHSDAHMLHAQSEPVFSVQAASHGLSAHPTSTSWVPRTWWAAAWTSACPASPSGSTASRCKACSRTSTLTASSSLWPASLPESSQCFAEHTYTKHTLSYCSHPSWQSLYCWTIKHKTIKIQKRR